jgi:hypothetical protein
MGLRVARTPSKDDVAVQHERSIKEEIGWLTNFCCNATKIFPAHISCEENRALASMQYQFIATNYVALF